MYVKYTDAITGTTKVRDISGFEVMPLDCTEEDGSVTHGAAICAGSINEAAFFAHSCMSELAAMLLDSQEEVDRRVWRKHDYVVTVDSRYANEEFRELAWFNSVSAATAVLEHICDKMKRGGQFFDLTAYGKNGEVNL